MTTTSIFIVLLLATAATAWLPPKFDSPVCEDDDTDAQCRFRTMYAALAEGGEYLQPDVNTEILSDIDGGYVHPPLHALDTTLTREYLWNLINPNLTGGIFTRNVTIQEYTESFIRVNYPDTGNRISVSGVVHLPVWRAYPNGTEEYLTTYAQVFRAELPRIRSPISILKLSFPNYFDATNTLPDPPDGLYQLCGGIQFGCTGGNEQYTDVDDCVSYMESVGGLNDLLGTKLHEKSARCPGAHLPNVFGSANAPGRPEVHCNHVGPNDTEYCAVDNAFLPGDGNLPM